MNVDVHDRNTSEPEIHLGMASSDGHVVEDAEPHRGRAQSVVARRAYESESSGLDGAHRAPCGEARRFPRCRTRECVLIQPDLLEDRVDGVDVRAIVNPLDLRAFGLLSVDKARKAIEEPLEPVRALGMSVMTG